MKVANGFIAFTLLLALSSFLTYAASAEDVVNTASLLRNLYDLDRLALPSHGACKRFSSYDRHENNADVGTCLECTTTCSRTTKNAKEGCLRKLETTLFEKMAGVGFEPTTSRL
jgi:hypothetical protein